MDHLNRAEMAADLDKQLKFYIAHQDEILKEHENRFLLICGEKLIESFETRGDAYSYGLDHFKPGTFMIVKCTPGNSEYTVDFRSVHRFSPMATVC